MAIVARIRAFFASLGDLLCFNPPPWPDLPPVFLLSPEEERAAAWDALEGDWARANPDQPSLGELYPSIRDALLHPDAPSPGEK